MIFWEYVDKMIIKMSNLLGVLHHLRSILVKFDYISPYSVWAKALKAQDLLLLLQQLVTVEVCVEKDTYQNVCLPRVAVRAVRALVQTDQDLYNVTKH